MESRPDAVLTYCHYERVNSELNPTGELRTCRPLYDDPLRQFLRGNRMVTPSQALLRRESLEKIGLFDETIRGTADWDMWLRCCGAGAVISDPRVMTLYRQHGAQWSRNRMMIRLGEVQVLEKTAAWALPLRPDLRRPLAKSLSRALRLLALEQLASATGRRESAATLLRNPHALVRLEELHRFRPRIARPISERIVPPGWAYADSTLQTAHLRRGDHRRHGSAAQRLDRPGAQDHRF